ncbi:hypothetical protein TTHERM_00522730 (macronuclear) [Tetrahymena thermophila SB210]|uniref:Uncharacterized protein n=1 Tax=Tetrahymena thermophila (strain SB210) TaxID=312017 RepID=I7M7M1_TETTS|nr:hypothetical protein TTHERM_00522730 [Tetrahymena thermophila SB210]EAR94206.2 hypothetical protein TTHERM_00522730 [Tetrahymena thermophila SB210]|eukprot:XP_001014451.2 hypothetical protein TTHERM_00522730 [Tetrahymena thermophila SB210]
MIEQAERCISWARYRQAIHTWAKKRRAKASVTQALNYSLVRNKRYQGSTLFSMDTLGLMEIENQFLKQKNYVKMKQSFIIQYISNPKEGICSMKRSLSFYQFSQSQINRAVFKMSLEVLIKLSTILSFHFQIIVLFPQETTPKEERRRRRKKEKKEILKRKKRYSLKRLKRLKRIKRDIHKKIKKKEFQIQKVEFQSSDFQNKKIVKRKIKRIIQQIKNIRKKDKRNNQRLNKKQKANKRLKHKLKHQK